MIKIIPAILAKTEQEFVNMVRAIEPYTDLVHLDIADGEFVPNKTIDGYEELMRIETKLNFEIHLMINNPESVIGRWLKTKAVRYLIHPESVEDLETLINQIKGNGRELGLVLNPENDHSAIEPYLDRIDLVQFMTVDPGFYGSLFRPEVLEKIRNFHSRYPNKIIQVDGAINTETIKLVEEAGASRAAVGSHIFKSNNVEKAIRELNV
ncbi:MAG: ribulose-phosphate 3-epimerase [Patescibacteria group bacterium]